MSRFLFYLCLGVILAVVVLVAWQKIADLMDQDPSLLHVHRRLPGTN